MLIAGGMLALWAYFVIKPALFVVILSGIALSIFYACLRREWRTQLGWAPALVAVALPLLAWSLPNVWLLYAAMALVVPVAARRDAQIAPLYLFALLLLPGLDTVIVIGTLKLFDCGVHDMLGIGALARLALAARRTPVAVRFDLPAAALITLLVFAIARDTSMTNALRVAITMLLDCAMPYYILSRAVSRPEDVKRCMVHLAAAAAILAVVLLYEVRTSWPVYNGLYNAYGLNLILLVKQRGGYLRSGGPFLESTSVAMVMAWCILAAWLARFAFRTRLSHRVVLGLLLVGLTAPQSRGAWIGLLLGTIVADLYRGRIAAIAGRLAGVAALGAVMVALAPAVPYLANMLGKSAETASTVDYRARLLTRGMEEYWKSPLIGYSQPEVLSRLADMRQGEGIIDFVNTYLFFALVSGATGVVCFIAAFVFYIRGMLRFRGALGRADRSLAVPAFLVAGLVMPMEMLVFTSFGGRCEVMVFVLFGLAAAQMAFVQPPYRRRRASYSAIAQTA